MLQPLPYQREDIIRIEQFDGHTLNANEMGLGKTMETLWAILRNPHWFPVLVVCQASVKFNWKYEAGRLGLDAYVCESRVPPRYSQFDPVRLSPMLIINYDILKDWLPYLKAIGIRTIVFDECHYLQNPGSKRTKAANEMSHFVERVMALGGTPLSNNPIELYPVLHMLWPKAFPSFTEFAYDFCNPKMKPWGIQYGACNLDILHGLLKKLGMIRRLKVDVLPDLPKKMRRIIPCELSHPEVYHEASTDFMGWLRKNLAHRVRAASSAEALTRVGYLFRLAARLKFHTPVTWANKFLSETKEKLVMMAVHMPAVDVLARRLEAKSVVITGETPNRERHELIQKFQNDPDTRVIIGSRALWAGVTLTAASTMGATEFWWKPGELAQMEARIDRIGQTAVSWIHYFPAIGTIEERVCRLIDEKQGYLSSVLDGGPMPTDLNLCALILNELEKEV